MANANIGLFGMLNAGYNAVGVGFSALEKGMNALDNLAAVGELKTRAYLNEEELLAEEKLEVLKFKREETRARLIAARNNQQAQQALPNLAGMEGAAA